MKIYVSGPPVSALEQGVTHSAVIYKAILKKFGAEHDVSLPIRTPELDILGAKDFFAAISKKIGAAEAVITVIEKGDQSTPAEATIASLTGRPQYILEIDSAPRLLRGLPGVTGGTKVALEKLDGQLDEALKHLMAAPKPRLEPEAAQPKAA
ncbi:hypothetical protein JQ628_21260 [Bradyrhizobium lablabi]|uniref:hypothetical protein n=1 Tax=Bradyrhizobium lablabi TaxID=722472 RepID=UPI001BAB4EC5|nr:hypothetical protein [Bradyrhizobium lablabi]MBR1124072.1 hypothetical protein [Bradyrhizobium lablabi]